MLRVAPSPRARTLLCSLLILPLVVTVSASSAQADPTCIRVRNLLRRGLSAAEVSQFTGLSPSDVQFCAGGQNVIQPAGPPPHGAAGPAPLGAAGPAPRGAAGPAPSGAAGAPPSGAAGPAPHGAAGPAPGGFAR